MQGTWLLAYCNWRVADAVALIKKRFVNPAAPPCPQCQSAFVSQYGALWICPECAHEWTSADMSDEAQATGVHDAHGNAIQDADTVPRIKDLKVKGSSLVVKVGTEVNNIRLVEGDHDIDCKNDGVGAFGLKPECVKRPDRQSQKMPLRSGTFMFCGTACGVALMGRARRSHQSQVRLLQASHSCLMTPIHTSKAWI